MSEANKELVRRHFEEIFNRKNFAGCDEMMAEEYFEHAPGRANGPRAMRRTSTSRSARHPRSRLH